MLSKLGDDPKWGGEYLIDISTPSKRRRAATWIEQMLDGCVAGGFEAVEFDNLDSWTRFDGTPLARRVPFGRREAIRFATLLTERAHALGLAVAQKNTTEIGPRQARAIGFDFAIAEQCARYDECGSYLRSYDDHVIAIEYRRRYFDRACAEIGTRVSVVLRDRLLRRPGARGYRYDAC